MVLGKVAAPSAACCTFWPILYEQALNNNLTVFYTQPGYFWSDGLMAMLNERNRAACWLRIEPEDQDPGELLLSLIASARCIVPEAGKQTLDAMCASPGPVAGWEPLYAQLGQELVELLPGNSILVLEHAHHLHKTDLAADHLLNTFLPWINRRFPCVLTSQKAVPLDGLPGKAIEHNIEELRLDFPSARALFKESHCEIEEEGIQAAVKTNQGRAVALSGLCSAATLLDHKQVENTILKARNSEQLFTQLTQAILAGESPGAYQTLVVASRLAYSHPNLVSASIGVQAPLVGPWFQLLSDNWVRVCQIWNKSLKSVLRIRAELLQTAMVRAADFLFAQGAVEWAVRIYLEYGARASAARAIASVADRCMDLGLWQTLDRWLEQLPQETLEEWPRLVYIQSELEALRGEADSARTGFQIASQLFASRQDLDGFCESKLAESVLAAQQDDHDQAWSSALAASTLARRFGLGRQGNWANWQLGRMASAANKLDDALAFLGQVAEAENEPVFSHLFGQAVVLAQELQEAKQQRDYHRLAYLELQKSEAGKTHKLDQLLRAPLKQVKERLAAQNWSQIHPVLKFSSLIPHENNLREEPPGIWQKILQILSRKSPSQRVRQIEIGLVEPQVQPGLPLVQPVLLLPQAAADTTMEDISQDPRPVTEELQQESAPLNNLPEEEIAVQVTHTPGRVVAGPESETEGGADPGAKPAENSSFPCLAVHCLGPFQLFQNDQLIENWPLRKALAIFKYLLVHRQKYVPKEILMETFWPEAEPESARRNLHQAIYTLRQSLHTEESQSQYIMFTNDRYRLNPDIEVWNDAEEFERHCGTGKQLEKDQHVEQAISEYEAAINLYRGDFMADDLYEEWPANHRRYLWQEFLTTAHHLVEIYYSRNEYSIAASYCQRMLYLDESQEKAHLYLMKCFLAQGNRNQAVHQYHLCRKTLKVKMNMSPSREMVELYRQVTKQ